MGNGGLGYSKRVVWEMEVSARERAVVEMRVRGSESVVWEPEVWASERVVWVTGLDLQLPSDLCTV